MSKVDDPPASGQVSASNAARESLARFIEAASALDAAWHPALDCRSYPVYLPSFDSFVHDLIAFRDEVEAHIAVVESTITPLELTDPAAVRAWLTQLRTEIDDALGAGEDATRPLGKRTLGRVTARTTLLEARRALAQLLEAASRGIEALVAG